MVNAALQRWTQEQHARLSTCSAVRISGRVTAVNGILLECQIPAARVGDLCEVSKADASTLLAEIIGFTAHSTLLSALGTPDGIQVGARIRPLGMAHRIGVDEQLLGRVLDGFGRPLVGDGDGAFAGVHDLRTTTAVIAEALAPMHKPRISRALPTGIRAIDSAMLLGEGQRVGLFAGAGCGKTTLLAEMARNMDCDVIVFGLIGERGRELREFLDHELDDQLRQRSVLICATSDRCRRRGAAAPSAWPCALRSGRSRSANRPGRSARWSRALSRPGRRAPAWSLVSRETSLPSSSLSCGCGSVDRRSRVGMSTCTRRSGCAGSL